MKRSLLIILAVVALLIAANARIGSTTSGLRPAHGRDDCVQGCQKDNRDRVKECDIYYPSDSQPVKHRECLDKAKTKFDACIAAC